MERSCDFDIELFLRETNCDVKDLMDIIEDNLKELNKDIYNQNRSESGTWPRDTQDVPKHY